MSEAIPYVVYSPEDVPIRDSDRANVQLPGSGKTKRASRSQPDSSELSPKAQISVVQKSVMDLLQAALEQRDSYLVTMAIQEIQKAGFRVGKILTNQDLQNLCNAANSSDPYHPALSELEYLWSLLKK